MKLLIFWFCLFLNFLSQVRGEVNNVEENIALPKIIDFYWKQIPVNDSEQFDADFLVESKKIELINSYWTDLGYSPKGYGTYRVHIKLPDTNIVYAIHFKRIYTSCKVYANGKLLSTQLGKFAKDSENYIPNGENFSITLPQEKNIDLMLCVANFDTEFGGGIEKGITLNKLPHIKRYSLLLKYLDLFIMILAFFLAIYQFILWLLNQNNNRYLYLGLFCLSAMAKQFFIESTLVYDFFPKVPYDFVHKMRYIPVLGAAVTVLLYLKTFLKDQMNKYANYLFLGFYGLSFFIFLLSNTFIATGYAYYVFLSLPVLLAYGIYIVLRAVLHRVIYSQYIMINMIILALFVLNDILNALLLISSYYVVDYIFPIFVLTQTYIDAQTQKMKNREFKKMKTKYSKQKDILSVKNEQLNELKLDAVSRIHEKEKFKGMVKKIVKKDISVSSIIADLSKDHLEDKKKELFINELDEKHQLFVLKVREQHPSISKTEIEIIVLIKLRKTRSEIAQIRGTSLEAVKAARKRLRKKMNLSKDVLLDDYLDQF